MLFDCWRLAGRIQCWYLGRAVFDGGHLGRQFEIGNCLRHTRCGAEIHNIILHAIFGNELHIENAGLVHAYFERQIDRWRRRGCSTCKQFVVCSDLLAHDDNLVPLCDFRVAGRGLQAFGRIHKGIAIAPNEINFTEFRQQVTTFRLDSQCTVDQVCRLVIKTVSHMKIGFCYRIGLVQVHRRIAAERILQGIEFARGIVVRRLGLGISLCLGLEFGRSFDLEIWCRCLDRCVDFRLNFGFLFNNHNGFVYHHGRPQACGCRQRISIHLVSIQLAQGAGQILDFIIVIATHEPEKHTARDDHGRDNNHCPKAGQRIDRSIHETGFNACRRFDRVLDRLRRYVHNRLIVVDTDCIGIIVGQDFLVGRERGICKTCIDQIFISVVDERIVDRQFIDFAADP